MASVLTFARLARSFLSLPLVVAALEGCGSDTPAGGPAVSASEVGTYEKFLERAAGLSCGAQAACCTTRGYEPNDDCAEDLLKAGFAQGFDTRGNYSPEGAATCLSSISASAGGGTCASTNPTTVEPRPFAPDPCQGVFRGPNFNSVPLNGPCVLNGDCISAGDNARTACSAGASPSSSAMRCRASVTAYPGEPCGEGIGTEEGKTFTCLSSAECVDSVCVAFPSEGEACGKNGRCAPNLLCAGGGAKAVCASRAKQGAACVSSATCESNLYCDGVVCKARGKAGDACAFSGDSPGGGCEVDLYCDGVVCKPYGKTGDVCQSGSTCRSGACSKGRCEGLSTSGPGSLAPYCK